MNGVLWELVLLPAAEVKGPKDGSATMETLVILVARDQIKDLLDATTKLVLPNGVNGKSLEHAALLVVQEPKQEPGKLISIFHKLYLTINIT